PFMGAFRAHELGAVGIDQGAAALRAIREIGHVGTCLNGKNALHYRRWCRDARWRMKGRVPRPEFPWPTSPNSRPANRRASPTPRSLRPTCCRNTTATATASSTRTSWWTWKATRASLPAIRQAGPGAPPIRTERPATAAVTMRPMNRIALSCLLLLLALPVAQASEPVATVRVAFDR